jgi:AcrR family transcriptional regulator
MKSTSAPKSVDPAAEKCRGRPRAFCCEKALDAAVRVFWAKGFEGASLPDLTKAMGINRPSLYAAFGNKESLFRKAMDRYEQTSRAHFAGALAAPTAREGVERFLTTATGIFTDPANPGGCMMLQGGMTCSDATAATKRDVAKRSRAAELALQDRIDRAIAAGELPRTTSAEHLARFYGVVLHGLALDAKAGATREQLLSVVSLAMQCWPAAMTSR